MYRLNVDELSNMQVDVLLAALEHYAMHAKQLAVHADEIDLPDVKRMWLGRAYAATDMRKGVI